MLIDKKYDRAGIMVFLWFLSQTLRELIVDYFTIVKNKQERPAVVANLPCDALSRVYNRASV